MRSQRFPKGLSLRLVLTAPFLLQIFTAVGLTGWLSFRSGQKAINDLAQQLSQKVTTSVEGHVRSFAGEPHLFLQLNEAAIRTQNLDLKNLPTLERYFWQQVQLSPSVNSLYLGDPDGNFLMIQQQETDLLYLRNASTAPLREIYRLDAQGDRINQLKQQPYDPRERPWYKATVAAKRPTWSPVYLFAAEPVLGITPTVPIYNEARELQGVMAVDLTLEQISNFLGALDISESGQAFIIERSGLVVATSAPELPFVMSTNGRERLQITNSTNPLIRATARHLQMRFGDFQQIHGRQPLNLDINGEKQFVQVTSLQDGRGLDWLLVVIIPQSDFMAQIRANMRLTIWLCTLALGAATLCGVITSNWIATPILQLSRMSQDIAESIRLGQPQGSLSRPIEVSSVKELDILAASFNQMTQRIQIFFTGLEHANRDLEVAVQQRTAELQQRIEREQVLVEQLEAKNQELEELANLDGLTQIANRRWFDDYLHQQWYGLARAGDSIALIVCDIDFFKPYNDTYGHSMGDLCLQQVAQVIRQSVNRSTDLAARIGGEEFAIVLPNTPLTGAQIIAQTIQNQLRTTPIPHATSPIPGQQITLSLGIANVVPHAETRPSLLFDQADRALYYAKSQGRNRIICYEEIPPEKRELPQPTQIAPIETTGGADRPPAVPPNQQ